MDAPWLTVVNPDIFLTYCAECAMRFRKGAKVQRIHGGYGYRCEACGIPQEPAPAAVRTQERPR